MKNKKGPAEKIRDLQKKRAQELARVEAEFNKKIAKLKKQVSPASCPHPDPDEFSWQWDDGYGRQKWMKGLRCTVCGCVNNWPGMSHNWSKPSDCDR